MSRLCWYTIACTHTDWRDIIWTFPRFSGLTWNKPADYIFPPKAPIVQGVSIEGLTLQAHRAAIVSWQGPFTRLLPLLALIGRFTVKQSDPYRCGNFHEEFLEMVDVRRLRWIPSVSVTARRYQCMLTRLDPHSTAISNSCQSNKGAIQDWAWLQMGQFMQQIVASFLFSLMLRKIPTMNIASRRTWCLIWLPGPRLHYNKNDQGFVAFAPFVYTKNSTRSAWICILGAPEWKGLKILSYLCKQGVTFSVTMVTRGTLLLQIKATCWNPTNRSFPTNIGNYWPGMLATVLSAVIAETHDGASFWHCPCVNTERFWKGTFPFLLAMFLHKRCLEEELQDPWWRVAAICARLLVVSKQAHRLGFKQTPHP